MISAYSVSIGLRQFGYHDPRVSFPTDKMIPGVFLGIAEIQVTGFFYTILPVQDYKQISSRRNPTTLVRSVVESKDITSSVIPSCVNDGENFKFYDRDGNELIGDVELSLSQNTNTSIFRGGCSIY